DRTTTGGLRPMTSRHVPDPLRIFATILRPSPAVLLAGVAVLAWAGCTAWNSPGEMRAVYVVLLLCQSFSAASGFLHRARRGHFDPMLVAPAPRARVALAHATASIAPGIVTWLLVTVVEFSTNHRAVPLGLTLPSLSAVLYMSAVSWAAALPFARYSSGVAWLIVAI